MTKEITKTEFDSYESVRESGVTNMFDTKTVSDYSSLDTDTIIDILTNYSEYREKFYPKELELHYEAIELMATLNKKYNIDAMVSLDEYLDTPGAGRISPEDVMTIKELLNKF